MTAASPEAEQADLIRRMAKTLAAEAAQYDTDLADPPQRRGFIAGLTVSLEWIATAHETGKIDDASFQALEDLLGSAVASLKPENDGKH